MNTTPTPPADGLHFVRERRYIVIKLKDAKEFLTPAERARLTMLGEAVANSRRLCGRRELQCVVVESDWPEYEPTWKAIEARTCKHYPQPPYGEKIPGTNRGIDDDTLPEAPQPPQPVSEGADIPGAIGRRHTACANFSNDSQNK